LESLQHRLKDVSHSQSIDLIEEIVQSLCSLAKEKDIKLPNILINRDSKVKIELSPYKNDTEGKEFVTVFE